MVTSFSQAPSLSVTIPVHSVTPTPFYLEQISTSLESHIFNLFLSVPSTSFFFSPSFSFSVQSGMLAQPSSVGGGPHIPHSRSAGGKGGGGCLVYKTHTHIHTRTLSPHTPRTLPQESSLKPAAALSEELVTIQHIVRTYTLPEASFSKTADPFFLHIKLKTIFSTFLIFKTHCFYWPGLVKGCQIFKSIFCSYKWHYFRDDKS